MHVNDLVDEHRRQHRPDARDRLHRPVPRVRDQAALGQPGEGVNLDVQGVDEPLQRLDPCSYGAGASIAASSCRPRY